MNFSASAGDRSYEVTVEDAQNSCDNQWSEYSLMWGSESMSQPDIQASPESEYSLMWGSETDLDEFEDIVDESAFEYQNREELHGLSDGDEDRLFQVAYGTLGNQEIRWIDGHKTEPYSIILSSEENTVEPLQEYFEATVAEDFTDGELSSFFDEVMLL